MSIKRAILGLMMLIVTLLIIQTVTFKLIAPGQLKKELLSEPFESLILSDSSDSIFIRDFFVTDCGSYIGVYTSHDLAEDEKMLKDKLGVKFIQFQDKNDHSWNNPEENKFRLVYDTWTYYPGYWTPRSLFVATQTEVLSINRKYSYYMESRYRWILFFWTKSFEFIDSRDYCDEN